MTNLTEITKYERLFTPEEIAKFFNVTATTVIKWINEGALRGFQLNRTYRVTYEDLQSFIKSHRTGRTGS